MEPGKLIQYMYFLNIGVVCSDVYLIVLHIILGNTMEAAERSVYTALQLAVTLWFRKRFDLWP